MSESTVKDTMTLLPAASVDVFIRDPETTKSAQSVGHDWRFARVNVNVEAGDVETAILAYQRRESPALVIIETDTTSESFVGRLEVLAQHCKDSTAAIVVGPVNDVNLYRTLMEMGISDYLVKPVPHDTFCEVIAKTLLQHLGTSQSRLISMVGSKGGVGTSALTQALAWGVSERFQQKTFLLDGAGGWSTLGVGFGFEPTTTLYEAVLAAEEDDLESLGRMMFKASEKLSVLASGGESMLDPSVDAQKYEKLIDVILSNYPVCIVDLSASVSSLKQAVVKRSHEVIVVSTPTLPALRASRSLLHEIRSLRGGQSEGLDVIINMSGMSQSKEVLKDDIAAALEIEPSVVVPFDPKLFIGSEGEGRRNPSDRAWMETVKLLSPLAQTSLSNAREVEPAANKNQGVVKKIMDVISS